MAGCWRWRPGWHWALGFSLAWTLLLQGQPLSLTAGFQGPDVAVRSPDAARILPGGHRSSEAAVKHSDVGILSPEAAEAGRPGSGHWSPASGQQVLGDAKAKGRADSVHSH